MIAQCPVPPPKNEISLNTSKKLRKTGIQLLPQCPTHPARKPELAPNILYMIVVTYLKFNCLSTLFPPFHVEMMLYPTFDSQTCLAPNL